MNYTENILVEVLPKYHDGETILSYDEGIEVVKLTTIKKIDVNKVEYFHHKGVPKIGTVADISSELNKTKWAVQALWNEYEMKRLRN